MAEWGKCKKCGEVKIFRRFTKPGEKDPPMFSLRAEAHSKKYPRDEHGEWDDEHGEWDDAVKIIERQSHLRGYNSAK